MILECLRCGNCCPDTCEYKRRESNDLFSCTIHPSLGGNERDELLMCGLEPHRVYFAGIACRATILALGLDPNATETVKLQNGQVIRAKNE